MTSTLPDARPRTRRGVAVAAYAVALLAWSGLVGIPNDPIGVALWLWLLAVCWRIDLPRRAHLEFARDWWPWMLALVVYWLVRGFTDDLGFTPHVTEPIRADAWLAGLWGGQEAPTVALQQAWCGDPCSRGGDVRWYDVVLNAVYASHFVAGLTIAGVLWLRDRALWLQWIRRYVTISFLALAGYVAYPMAPPWMAARDGYLDPVARITNRAFRELGIERQSMVIMGLPNQTAAMPSLHAGISFLIAFFAIRRLRAWWRWLLLAYPVAMSLALVYFAEHYLVDAVAGAAIAALAMAGCSWWERRRVGGPDPATA